MTTQELFQESKPELCAQLSTVTKSAWFQECLVYVDSAVLEDGGISVEFAAGARSFKSALMALSVKPNDPPKSITPHFNKLIPNEKREA
jgi:hypothetical protein